MQGTSSGYAASVTLLSGVTVTGAGATTLFKHSITQRTVQATVLGTGAVSATVVIEVSNDATNWLTAGTITLSGTTTASDGFVFVAPWLNIRGNVTAISGTGAAVTAVVAV